MNWLLLIAVAMAAAATAAVLMPLLRKPKAPPAPRDEYDLVVYKDQLAEIGRDLERGLIQPAEAEAATIEVQRRMLALADAAGKPGGKSRTAVRAPSAARRRWVAVAVATAIPVVAFVVYGFLGSPDMPGQPFAGRDIGREKAAHGGQPEHAELSQMADRLAEKMKQRPDDANGWLLLGRTYVTVGRFADALKAIKRALDLSGHDPEVAALYGETLVISQDGRMTPEATALFREVARADPMNPQARYYIGLGLAQEGKTREALQAWVDLKALTPADAPWIDNLNEQIERARQDLKLPAEALLPSPEARELAKRMPPAAAAHPPATAGAAPPGPNAADVEAAQQMAPEAQKQMIQGMVARLADRLKQNPDDLEGWRRLARAYEVMGDAGKAKEANARVEALEKRQASPARPGPAAGLPPPGPSAADVEAAQQMAPEAQKQMIRGMVERLAERLTQNPDDLDGWRRLARAYEVMGDAGKAKEANARVEALEKKAR